MNGHATLYSRAVKANSKKLDRFTELEKIVFLNSKWNKNVRVYQKEI